MTIVIIISNKVESMQERLFFFPFLYNIFPLSLNGVHSRSTLINVGLFFFSFSLSGTPTKEIVHARLPRSSATLRAQGQRARERHVVWIPDTLLPHIGGYVEASCHRAHPPSIPHRATVEASLPPCWDATGAWLWKLAKAHVCAHDAGYHQLVIHWLRTHCCIEPYIIAANRQLSAMHPIYRLLQPHFRYTMEINANAREQLVNADGVIESTFSPGKYSAELSSVAYKQQWRFDMEALPADLIRRGMAVADPTAEHGVRLTVEDYPFANDGLLVWSAIEQWVTDYVNFYYPEAGQVKGDNELQAWWTEVRTKGHADKKDEPWWPVLNAPEDLIQVLTTIIWVASGHHAAVNFGQYHYAGYFPNHPSITRKNMPVEDAKEHEFAQFLKKPEFTLLSTLPSQIQAAKVVAVLDLLSSHSPDEEYLGEQPEPAWAEEPKINAAFERFNGRMREIEGIIDGRNANPKLANRCGAGVVPYELLKPFSKPGVTGMGIPNSVSI